MTRHPESHQEIIPIPTKVNELNKGLEKVWMALQEIGIQIMVQGVMPLPQKRSKVSKCILAFGFFLSILFFFSFLIFNYSLECISFYISPGNSSFLSRLLLTWLVCHYFFSKRETSNFTWAAEPRFERWEQSTRLLSTGKVHAEWRRVEVSRRRREWKQQSKKLER